MNNIFISSAKKDEAVENFVKSKREDLKKMIPGFVDDRKFTDIVLNFYERGIRDGAQMMLERMTGATAEIKLKGFRDMKTGIELIADERQRQIDVEGYSAQHDSQHKASEFAYAIIAYAEAAKAGINCRESGITDERYISMAKSDMGRHFPWGEFKTTTDIRDLTKVGALAAALIDRLQGEVAVEIEEKPRIISSFVEKHPTNGIISITINTSEKWVTYQINKVATRGFVNITMLSDSSGCTESIEVPDFDANDYQIFSAQEKDQITIMCIPFAMIKECK